ncbi:hypothetical protein JOE58_002608 [Curtobacterium luteum]|uniref:Histidine kinase/HSP90-like ATPase domain-containing protein n=1 Tax=Curtobacterium luteum TaxID=33881 RepID=A0ABS2RWI3_9MICO|nr:hypothetical protein [Curtobacterium luteum]MBM7803357.1 hypothetical protein [Curtobacterium luteum]
MHAAFEPAASKGVMIADLARLRFITPAGLVTIAAYAHRARAAGREVRVLRPASDDVANYVSRARLGKELDDMGAAHNLPSVREHDVGQSLLAVTPFENASGAAELATRVWEVVHEQDSDAAAIMHMSISAMGENVIEHSRWPRGYAAAQKTYGGSVFRFAVADAGRGFSRALRRYKPADDAHALELALEPGVSGLDEESRGYGLSELRDSVKAIGGTLRLRSGRGQLVVSPSEATQTLFASPLPVSVLEGELRVKNHRR